MCVINCHNLSLHDKLALSRNTVESFLSSSFLLRALGRGYPGMHAYMQYKCLSILQSIETLRPLVAPSLHSGNPSPIYRQLVSCIILIDGVLQIKDSRIILNLHILQELPTGEAKKRTCTKKDSQKRDS